MRVQLALEEMADEVKLIAPDVALTNAHLAEHIRRSTQSGVFNTAEAIAAWNPKVKVYRYEVGRREINEARAGLRLAVRQGDIDWARVRRAYNLAGAIIGMLTAAARAVEEGKGRDEEPEPPLEDPPPELSQ